MYSSDDDDLFNINAALKKFYEKKSKAAVSRIKDFDQLSSPKTQKPKEIPTKPAVPTTSKALDASLEQNVIELNDSDDEQAEDIKMVGPAPADQDGKESTVDHTAVADQEDKESSVDLSTSQGDIYKVLKKIDDFFENTAKSKRGRKSAKKTPTKRKQPLRTAKRRTRNRNNCYESDEDLPPMFAKKNIIINLDKEKEYVPILDEANAIIPVKVWWRFKQIDRFEIRKFQKVECIFEHYAKLENITEDKLLFTLKDTVLKKTDSPDSLGLDVGSIIEGGILSKSLEVADSPKKKKKATDLEFKIQQKDCKKYLVIGMDKEENMAVLIAKVAGDLNLPMDSFKLYFDGDVINPGVKPHDLELEGGECIDLRII